VPAPPDHQFPAGPQPIADPGRAGAALPVLALASSLMQEMRARQTHPDLGMITKPDQFRFRIWAATTPAREGLCGI
jgi:hypothetical protein